MRERDKAGGVEVANETVMHGVIFSPSHREVAG